MSSSNSEIDLDTEEVRLQQFVKIAKSYSSRHNFTYQDFIDRGIPASYLDAAGIQMPTTQEYSANRPAPNG